MPWAGKLPGWEFSRSIEVVDSLTNTPFGRVVLDRHGICDPGLVICDPFSVSPGRLVLVTLWNSNSYGCGVQVIVQKAPAKNLESEKVFKSIVPVSFDIGVSNQRVPLLPAKTIQPRFFQYKYNYTVADKIPRSGLNLGDILSGKNTKTIEAPFYVASTLLSIDREAAKIMASAPEENARARITFADSSILTYEIGASTVREWKNVMAYNPNCSQVQPGTAIAIAEEPKNRAKPQILATSETSSKLKESANNSAIANVYGYSATPEDLLIAIGDLPMPKSLQAKSDFQKLQKTIQGYSNSERQEARIYLAELAKGNNKPLSDNLRKVLGRYLIFKQTGKVDF